MGAEINKTAVIILNYKNYSDTINCIRSLYEKNEIDLTVFVVDNASKNDSTAAIYNEFKGIKRTLLFRDKDDVHFDCNAVDIVIIENHHNTGYAAGNNVGLKIAASMEYQFLLVLNSDTLFIENDSLKRLKHTLVSKETNLCVGPKLVKPDGTIDYNCAKRRPTWSDFFLLSFFGKFFKTPGWHRNFYYLKAHPDADKPVEVGVISGSCMFFNAALFAEIGFFDEKTFLYYEEAIISEKARKKGYGIILDAGISVVHLGAASTKKFIPTSDFAVKCEYQSALHYLSKYRNVPLLLAKFICLGQWLYLPIRKFRK